MTPTPGTHELSADNGDILIYTSVEGPAAALGHNLILRPSSWQGRLVVGESPADSTLEVTVDLASLAVAGSRGGAKPVSPSDRKIIEANTGKALGVAGHPTLSFRATSIEGTWEKGTVTGQLTLRGQTQEQSFDVSGTDAGFEMTGRITQTRYGITPFSTMIGAMRLGDDVELKASIRL